jgi:hypothetical protein
MRDWSNNSREIKTIGAARRFALFVTLALAVALPALAATTVGAAAASAQPSSVSQAPPPPSTPPQSQLLTGPLTLSDGCPALLESLSALAAAGVRTAACISPVTPGASTRLSPASSASQQPAPSWCASNTQTTILFTRTESCGTYQGEVDVYDAKTRALVGQVFFNYINYSYTSTSIQTWAHQISIQVTSEWGLGAGSSVAGTVYCFGACRIDSSNFPPQAASPGAFDDGESFFDTTATASGAIGSSQTEWVVTWTNPSWTVQPSPLYVAQLSVRCDNALPGSYYIGCVFPGYISALVYQHTGPYPEIAQHIGDAQASGLPGAYPSGTPLTRLTDGNVQDQNRNTACPSSYTRPPGDSCDEYPFASTHQGAYLSGGGPRTFPYCLIVLTQQSTGSTGYSVCMLDANENSGAGNALGQFYLNNRIIEGDAFRVWITT